MNNKRRGGTSATQRTIRALKNEGMKCGIVERYIAQAGPEGKRYDLFGIIDIIALDPTRGVIGIQSCTDTLGAHLKKFQEERAEDCVDWLSTPGTYLEIWSWGKRKRKLDKGYSKALYWMPKVRVITLDDFL
jgi:hypothetical protein